jgi:hypothetical protein
MAVEVDPGPVVAHGCAAIGVGGGLLDIGYSDLEGGDEGVSRVWGPMGLVIPQRRATPRTSRAAPSRSRRLPSTPRYLAEQIPQAKLVVLPGDEHLSYVGDTDTVVDEIEEFLTGVRSEAEGDVVLTAVLFTDTAASTEHQARVGPREWFRITDRDDPIGSIRPRPASTCDEDDWRRLSGHFQCHRPKVWGWYLGSACTRGKSRCVAISSLA